MEKETFEKFIEKVNTKEDLSVLLDQIDEAARWVYKDGESLLSERLAGAVSEEFCSLIAGLEKEEKLPHQKEEQAAFFKNLKNFLAKQPTIKITLAFTPSRQFLTDLASRLRKEIGQKVILEILVKEELIGGAIFEYGGEYRDYSLARKLDELLEKGEMQKLKPSA